MPKLIRQPLMWMVIAECIVVTLLVVLAWNLIASAAQHTGAAAAQALDVPAQSQGSPPADLPEPARPDAHAQLPGLNLDPGFWRARLGQLNREQFFLEQLEWRIAHDAMDAAQRYLETVVLPAVTRAERRGG